MSKQIKTDVEVAYKKRNKATVFWRGILVFPVAVFIGAFAVNSNSGLLPDLSLSQRSLLSLCVRSTQVTY
jgi:hypothetical protein